MKSPSIHSRRYGTRPDGAAVDAWTLTAEDGFAMECLTHGAILSALRIPIHGGQTWINVVLSLPSLAAYLADDAYLGCMVGRVAGRVRDATFDLGSDKVRVTRNEGRNHVHGGAHAFSRALWAAEPQSSPRGRPSLELQHTSPAGEEGYPGNVQVQVTYRLDLDYTLTIETTASTDQTTPFSLTNHSYFNLSGGEAATIETHTLSIHSDAFFPMGTEQILAHEALPVEGRAEDMRKAVRLADVLPLLPYRHGAAYALRGGIHPLPAATFSYASERNDGATLVQRCSTTQTCLQTYSASSFNGKPHQRHAGLCLECQGLPNLTDARDPRNILLHPGAPQRHITKYQFRWE